MSETVECKKANKLVKGCVVMMKATSGIMGYGNAQCVSDVCEPLGTLSLYGHNEHCKIHQVQTILEYPYLPQPPKGNECE